MQRLVIIILLLHIIPKAEAYRYGVSSLFINVGQTTTSEDGELNLLGEGSYYPFFLEWEYVGLDYTLKPRLSYSLIPRVTGTEATESSVLILTLPFEKVLSLSRRFRYGVSYLSLEQRGRGGAVQLNNGPSVSTFYRPNQTRVSSNLLLQAAYEIQWSQFSIDIEALVGQFLTPTPAVHLNIGLVFNL